MIADTSEIKNELKSKTFYLHIGRNLEILSERKVIRPLPFSTKTILSSITYPMAKHVAWFKENLGVHESSESYE